MYLRARLDGFVQLGPSRADHLHAWASAHDDADAAALQLALEGPPLHRRSVDNAVLGVQAHPPARLFASVVPEDPPHLGRPIQRCSVAVPCHKGRACVRAEL
eukprot:15385057-Alexandrium_andersonii.AAC.1